MPEKDKRVGRKGDAPGTHLEIIVSPNGNVCLFVKGRDPRDNLTEVQLEFIKYNGTKSHPKTIQALYDLAKAMEEDNNDIEAPERYRFP